MSTRQRCWLAVGAGVALVAALGGVAGAAAPAKGAAAPVGAKKKAAVGGPIIGEALPGKVGSRLDLLFVIDSTGSMGGIIDDGKREMRKIVDDIKAGDPPPDLRVGLLTYRDKGDDYLTKYIPLSRDFEAFYKFMSRVEAGGGGDWEEHVSLAMHVAISKFNWDLDKNTARMVFLIGDAPAHTDYDDGWDFEKEAKIARDEKIVVNTLAMVDDPKVAEQFKKIASITGGAYKVIGTGSGDAVGAGDGDGDHYEEHDYSGSGDPAAAKPSSGMGKAITEAVKAEAAKKGTVYEGAKPAPAPKKKPK
ncbi:MAG TPA: vWA domain-containing protein [Myxococcota bacterium]|nr:vWA domain-containing protein [Myxococcota bacterium]